MTMISFKKQYKLVVNGLSEVSKYFFQTLHKPHLTRLCIVQVEKVRLKSQESERYFKIDDF